MLSCYRRREIWLCTHCLDKRLVTFQIITFMHKKVPRHKPAMWPCLKCNKTYSCSVQKQEGIRMEDGGNLLKGVMCNHFYFNYSFNPDEWGNRQQLDVYIVVFVTYHMLFVYRHIYKRTVFQDTRGTTQAARYHGTFLFRVFLPIKRENGSLKQTCMELWGTIHPAPALQILFYNFTIVRSSSAIRPHCDSGERNM